MSRLLLLLLVRCSRAWPLWVVFTWRHSRNVGGRKQKISYLLLLSFFCSSTSNCTLHIVICVPSTEQALGSQYTFENACFCLFVVYFPWVIFLLVQLCCKTNFKACSSLYKTSLYEINYAPLISLKHGRNCNAPKQSRTLLSFLYQGRKRPSRCWLLCLDEIMVWCILKMSSDYYCDTSLKAYVLEGGKSYRRH